MKNKGELLRTKDGKYYKPEGSKETNEETKESKYDFTNFVQIKASSRKEPEEMCIRDRNNLFPAHTPESFWTFPA